MLAGVKLEVMSCPADAPDEGRLGKLNTFLIFSFSSDESVPQFAFKMCFLYKNESRYVNPLLKFAFYTEKKMLIFVNWFVESFCANNVFQIREKGEIHELGGQVLFLDVFDIG